ncbi:MAG TPA: putative LPS assembly protein LptD [Bacteroidia bacterium]|nr:putative LPS assembly protein LptD [Bacteroidia bacterium]
MAFKKILTLLLTTIALIFVCLSVVAQSNADTSLNLQQNDTLKQTIIISDDLRSEVKYFARDSIVYDISINKIYLYGDAKVTYENIELTAAFIELDWNNKEVSAQGIPDSTGSFKGLPVFKEASNSFSSSRIRYNFDTKKGKIYEVTTQQGEGYIHGTTVKKTNDVNYYIRSGKYTTCNDPHPHYFIGSSKLKIINNDKIVSGPANLVISDIPTPFFIPFGYFPYSSKRKSGIIIPGFGESANRGFYLLNGGYYFGINDYIDLELLGDIYSLGSWGLKTNSRYINRYKYNGSFGLSYSINSSGDKELPGYSRSKDFFIRWNHSMDPKARPNTTFSASVNAGSSTYYTNNLSSANNYLSNTFTSSIAWSRFWPGKPYNLSLSANHSQNTISRDVSITLPNASFGVSTLYPFKPKINRGTNKWFHKLGVSYQGVFSNQISNKDTLLFKKDFERQMRNGFSHSIPISTSIKAFKFFTWSNSVSYRSVWYFKTIEKSFDIESNQVNIDTINGFKTAHELAFSSSLNTRVYGMINFKNGFIKAFRHVFTPSVGFSIRPDYSRSSFGYYKRVDIDTLGNSSLYSIFEQGIYGGPAAGKSGFVSLGLDNNFEMKVRAKTDSGYVDKKIKLLESLSFNTGYNIAADSLRWSPLSMNARTTVLEKLNMSFSSAFDWYVTNENGIRLNRLEINENKRLARLTAANFSSSYSLIHQRKSIESDKGSKEDLEHIRKNKDQYVDYSIPFNLYLTYSMTYSKPGDKLPSNTVQTLGFNGDLALTPKWKITYYSGWDFNTKKLSYSSIGFYRDLHCWEMSLNWIPTGGQQSYFFKINVKSSILQDLKLTKKSDQYDF